MAATWTDAEDPELEALMKENAALQSENDTLRAETAEFGFESDPSVATVQRSESTTAAILQARFEALKREQQALQGLLRVGEELQDLRKANSSLRETARNLYEENKSLRDHNANLCASQTAQQSQQAYASANAASQRGPTELELRAREIADAIRNGESDLISNIEGNPKQRKAFAAGMLKAAIFDPVQPQAGTGARPAPVSRNDVCASKAQAPSSASQTSTFAGTAQETEHRQAAQFAARPTPQRAPASAELVDRGSRSSSKRSAGSSINPKAEKLGEALKKGDKSALKGIGQHDRKEMIADMLKAGLCNEPKEFSPEECSSPVRIVPVTEEMSFARQDAVRSALKGLKVATTVPRPGSPVSPQPGSPESLPATLDNEDNEYGNELAFREMLKGLAGTGTAR